MIAAWGASLAWITVRDLGLSIPLLGANSSCKGNRIGGLPAPGDFLATFVVFAPLSLMEASSNAQVSSLAKWLGWGWFLGVVLMPCLGTPNLSGTNTTNTTSTPTTASTSTSTKTAG